MNLKIDGRNKEAEIKKLTSMLLPKIKQAVFKPVIKSLQDSYIKHFPKVTGTTAKSVRRIHKNTKTFTNNSKAPIMRIGKGEPALLLQRYFKQNSITLSRAGLPMFKSFQDSPHLKDWVLTRMSDGSISEAQGLTFLNKGGLVVGGINTRFGSEQNQWFKHGTLEVKKTVSGRIKSSIKKELSR